MTSSPVDEDSWWRLGRDEWKTVLKRTLKEFKDDDVQSLSAVVTLRLVLSLVPSLIAAVAIAARFISTERIRQFVLDAETIVPPESQEFVIQQLSDVLAELQNGGIGVAAIAAGLFAASSAAVALIKALNKAYGVEESRKFVAQRVASLVVLGSLALALAGMLVSLVLGPPLLEAILPASIVESPLRFLIALGRYLVALVLLMVFFAFVFWYGPNRPRGEFHLLSPGAVLGVTGWIVLSYLFSVYVRVAGSYSATYGAAAGIVVLLIWLQYSFIVLLMGAELDNEMRRFVAERAPSAAPAADLDEVTPEMPRHPGLMNAASDPSSDRTGDRAQGDQEGDARTGAPRVPRLVGAAATTSGAAVAGLLWGALRTKR